MGCRIIRRNQEVKAYAGEMPVRCKAEVRQRYDVAWKGIDMSTLWVIGDSTLSSFNDKYYYPRYGYGTKLGCYLNDKVTVRNIALSGRSSKSYTKEPEYKELLENMKQGDFLIIGFGHNDEKTEAGRYTSPSADYKSEGTFAASLYNNYIVPANNSGCSVILCTPIVRRSVTGKWKDSDLHITKDVPGYKGGDYSKAVLQLGEELDIPVVDMTSKTKKLYEELTENKTIYLHAWPSNNEKSVDNTHTNIWGARVNAYMVMSAIKDMNIPGLSENICNIENDYPIPSMDKYLESNKDYKPTVFSSDLQDSTLWEDCEGFKGTVFGDVLCDVNKDNFTLEKDKDGNIHIEVRNDKGKISEVTDGIAMYYKQVPADENFIFTAKMKINRMFYNDQVSFGLMVRDDMYIDRRSPDILGDYVAAAPLKITRKEEAFNCFARKNGEIINGGTVSREYKEGEVVDLRISSTSDGYALKFGDEPEVTGGFDFKLTAIDPEHVYVGMFVSRNADVTFMNVKYQAI